MRYETQELRLKKLIDECRAEQKAQEELFAKEKPLFLSVRSIALDTNPNLRLTPLMYAIKKGRRDKLVELLIDSGEGVNTKVPAAAMAAVHKGGDYGEVTPLIHAVRHENVQMVRQLVECGAVVDTQVAPGRTALMFAVRQQPGEHSELSDDAIEIAIFLTETTTKKERKRNSSREVNLDEAAPPETTRSDITLTTLLEDGGLGHQQLLLQAIGEKLELDVAEPSRRAGATSTLARASARVSALTGSRQNTPRGRWSSPPDTL